MILFDTDILIKIFRGNSGLRKELIKHDGNISISLITALELYRGCNTKTKVAEMEIQLKSYSVLPLSEKIGTRAVEIFQEYKPKNNVEVADSLIAATALVYDLELFTDNKKDFSFIKGIKFHKA